jgi:hypothetical protein
MPRSRWRHDGYSELQSGAVSELLEGDRANGAARAHPIEFDGAGGVHAPRLHAIDPMLPVTEVARSTSVSPNC